MYIIFNKNPETSSGQANKNMNPLSNREIVLIVIVILSAFLIGYLLMRCYNKRRNDIVKVEIRKDLLPNDGQGNGWVQNGACMMSDGTSGIVKGKYCEQTNVL